MPRSIYETERLWLMPSHPRFTKAAADFGRRNAAFFQENEALHPKDYYALAQVRRALSADRHNAASGTGFRVWMVSKGTDRFIGTVALGNILWSPFYSCFLGYKMDQDHTGKGLATEAVARVIRVAFEEFRLHRVEAYVMPHNAASLRVVEKLGFQAEGIAKRNIEINGVWEDHIRLALLNEGHFTVL